MIPIVVRYERVWLRDHISELAFANGVITELNLERLSQDRVTIGANYKPTPQFGWQFAYVHNRRLEGDTLIFPETDQSSSNGFLMGWTFSFRGGLVNKTAVYLALPETHRGFYFRHL